MGRIHSPVSDVSELTFYSMPSKKMVAMKAGVRVGHTHVFVDAVGKVYSTQVKERCSYTLGCGLEDTLAGCRVLGLLSKEAVDSHNQAMNLKRAKDSRYYAAVSIQDTARELGLIMTKAQTTAIKTALAR